MKRLIIPIILLLSSCQERLEEPVVNPAPQPVFVPEPSKYYAFGAVNYSYDDFNNGRSAKVLVSDVTQTGILTEDDRYRILDKIGNSVYITTNRNYRIEKRKVFIYSTYKEASEKRQEILKAGIQ